MLAPRTMRTATPKTMALTKNVALRQAGIRNTQMPTPKILTMPIMVISFHFGLKKTYMLAPRTIVSKTNITKKILSKENAGITTKGKLETLA